VLANDGQFVLEDEFGHALFSIVSLDNTPFTQDTLDNQAYRGFSLLFDVPNVPHGVKSFDQFMDLVVRLSSQLGLDLVDDNLEELSMQSLKNIRQYVIGRQEEMSKIGLVPGGELTHRLFS
jgi:FtsZ-interacting cell division protein ZipA